MMIVGCVLAASFVLSSAAVVFSEYDWRDLFDSGPPLRRANAAAAVTAAGIDFRWMLIRLNRFRRDWSVSRLVSPRRSAGGGPSPDDRSLDPHSSSSRWEPFVSRWVSMLKNPVVLSYLIPCALDAAVFVITLGTMFYYVQIVVAPEYQSSYRCNSGIAVGTYKSNDWRCRSEAVAGVVLSVLMAASLCFVCVWGWVAKHIGSVRAWQLSSIIGCLCSTSFVFSYRETKLHVPAAIGMGVLIGISFSARCLSDCILVDVIHYYEFISGCHYPHMFWMLKTWSAKVAIVLAAIVFLPVLYESGFKSPVHFINQGQNRDVKAVSTIFTIAIPALLGLVSFACKLRIRLCEGEQQDMIVRWLEKHRSRGWSSLWRSIPRSSAASTLKRSFDEVVPSGTIGLDSAGSLGDAPQPAADPVSGILYPHSFIGESNVAASRVFDLFFATSNVADYYSCSVAGSSQIGRSLTDRLSLSFHSSDHASAAARCGLFL
jgi:Na+/melibiose symporter-like transporter